MSFTKEHREQIKAKLIETIGFYEYYTSKTFKPIDFAKANKISVQTVYRYLDQLIKDGQIKKCASGQNNTYEFVDKSDFLKLDLIGASEDRVWREFVRPLLQNLSEPAFSNCNYAFTEMLNNAIDHSEGTQACILVTTNAYRVRISIEDNGIGIFTKIANAMNLGEKRFSVLELSKGKFTTDPESHTGEGIFFSSKAVDSFSIFSDGLHFMPLELKFADIDSVLSTCNIEEDESGTYVMFSVLNNHKQTMKELFDKYTQEPDHYGFTKTIVPVKLLEYGDDAALFTSRSQAKRLLARFEKFNYIDLDFSGIKEIGQGFADEIFRVFSNQHPNTKINAIHCSEQVEKMIERIGNTAP